LAICVAVLAAFPAFSSEIDELIADLRGDNETQRASARQELRRHGADAVPHLIVLLEHDEQPVWRAALRTLADIGHEVAVPGRDAERREVARKIMGFIASANDPGLKQRGLELAPIVLDDGYDVGPIAQLLTDDHLKVRARNALQRANTREARAALRNAFPHADTPFAVAIIDSLDKMGANLSKDFLVDQLGHDETAVQVAAARALASTGDPSLVDAYDRLRHNVDEEHRFDAIDAYIRYGEAVAERGGAWSLAMAIFREFARDHVANELQGAALAGLGRYGDETAVPIIMEAVRADVALIPQALLALNHVKGRAAYNAMLDAYEDAPEEMKPGLISVYGRTEDPLFYDSLWAFPQRDDPVIRAAAVEALAQSELPQGINAIANYVPETSGNERERMVDHLYHLAKVFGDNGNTDAAGKAYLGLYNVAEDDDQRNAALEGIKQYPSPEAIEVVMNDMDLESLADLSTETAASFAIALHRAERNQEAEHVFAALLPRLTTTKDVQQLMAMAQREGLTEELLPRLGFVTQWHVIGPFDFDFDEGFTQDHISPDTTEPQPNAADPAWQEHTTANANGMVDLIGLLGAHNNVSAYALANVTIDAEQDGQIRIGSDDGNRVWLNGKVVHENNTDRGSALDQDIVPVVFEEGTNTILVQITQGAGGWNFMLRLTDARGAPINLESISKPQK